MNRLDLIEELQSIFGENTNASMQERYFEALHERELTHLNSMAQSVDMYMDELSEIEGFNRNILAFVLICLFLMQAANNDSPDFSLYDESKDYLAELAMNKKDYQVYNKLLTLWDVPK